ncbi:STAS domain-containing protein [Streptomyces gardneri]|uniref:STAS domain-containing protein n=1 Tax=Streptomyces gardneri TaxID=66892 RepID=UPI0035E2EE21
MITHPRRPPTLGAGISDTSRLPVAAVDFEPGPKRVLARVCGEIDLDDADGLGQDLTAALDSSICGLDVDLSGVTFCDSSGLHMLLRLNRQAGRSGKTLVLAALGPRVARLLRLTETERLFTIHARATSSPPAEAGPTPPPGQGKLRSPLSTGVRR